MNFGQNCDVYADCNVKGYLRAHGGCLWVRGGYLSILEGYLGGAVTWVNQVGG